MRGELLPELPAECPARRRCGYRHFPHRLSLRPVRRPAATGPQPREEINMNHRIWIVMAMVGVATASEPAGVAPDEALRQLLAGNQRFVAGQLEHPHQSAERRTEQAT